MKTKRNPLYLTLFLLFTLTQSGCNRYEAEPINIRTIDDVFDEMDINGFFADQALNHIYTYLPNGYNRITSNTFLDVATDDAIFSRVGHNSEILSQARQSPVQLLDDIWEDSYVGLRRINIFLSKIDRVPMEEEIITRWKAEARFIRAMIYFELIKRYGGVPLLRDRILSLDDDLNIPRDSYEECVQFIVDECDALKDILPVDPNIASNNPFIGRIYRGAAYALKSRTLLYAASPLHNPTNDMQKWQAAFDAAEDMIGLDHYALLGNRINLFLQRHNVEVILAYQRMQSSDIERNHAPVGYSAPNASAGLTSPTQNLVDAFPMRNGLPITDPLSGYNPDNPYNNRDLRLTQTVFHNGVNWLNRAVETFDGGRDRPGGVITQTRTGYYLRKFMGAFETNTDYANTHHNFVIFRYAEILLNYAEAANELSHTNPALRTVAYNQLLAIRARQSVVSGTTRGLKANMTQEEMRTAIQLERRLEFAFEEHRFWDVRRWKIAETEFNKTLTGMRITRTGTNYTYTVEPVSSISFAAPQMYLYPIPLAEVLKNDAMVQNPGWQQ